MGNRFIIKDVSDNTYWRKLPRFPETHINNPWWAKKQSDAMIFSSLAAARAEIRREMGGLIGKPRVHRLVPKKRTPTTPESIGFAAEPTSMAPTATAPPCSLGIDMGTIDQAVLDARAELISATSHFGPFLSAHEGHAIIREEFDELWDEVMLNPKKIPYAGPSRLGSNDIDGEIAKWQRAEHARRLRKEAVQVAAMALRFIVDVCDAPAKS